MGRWSAQEGGRFEVEFGSGDALASQRTIDGVNMVVESVWTGVHRPFSRAVTYWLGVDLRLGYIMYSQPRRSLSERRPEDRRAATGITVCYWRQRS